MKIEISFNCDSAAFEPDTRVEIGRILREQADKVRLYPLDGLSEVFNIKDVDGNTVGEFFVSN